MTNLTIPDNIKNTELRKWVTEMVDLCKPDNVYWCDGSDAEFAGLVETMLDAGTIVPVPARPGSYLARSHPDDVARVEDRTFICSVDDEDAGAGRHGVGVDLDAVLAIFQRIVDPDHRPGELVLLADEDQALAQPGGKCGTEDEAARLDAGDEVEAAPGRVR